MAAADPAAAAAAAPPPSLSTGTPRKVSHAGPAQDQVSQFQKAYDAIFSVRPVGIFVGGSLGGNGLVCLFYVCPCQHVGGCGVVRAWACW